MESLAKHLPCYPGAIRSCRTIERIETFFLHLCRIISAERFISAFTRMHVASRIAGSPNPVSWMPTIVTMALENCLILDGTGSALCCEIVSDRSVCNHVTAEEDDANSGERRVGTAIPGQRETITRLTSLSCAAQWLPRNCLVQ